MRRQVGSENKVFLIYMLNSKSWLEMQLIPLTTTGTESLFLVSTTSVLLEHPFANVR